jgi:phosphoribosyl-ATP pyrophosphohydrolase/phosphoribosyl-AMP cyclohydrolase
VSKLQFLASLEEIVRDRIESPVEGSYTARLAAGGPIKVAQKLGEEGVETALAAVAQDDERVLNEAADLLYHLLILLALRGLRLEAVIDELERRHDAGSGRSQQV